MPIMKKPRYGVIRRIKERSHPGIKQYISCIGRLRQGERVVGHRNERISGLQTVSGILRDGVIQSGEYGKAMQELLMEVAETTSDLSTQEYSRAIQYYADKLDQIEA